MEKQAADTLEQLAARWMSGDENAFEEIYRNTERWVRGYVNQHMPSAEVDDCMQRIYIRLYQNKGKYDPRFGCFRPWLNRLVKNETIDYLRHLNSTTGNMMSVYAGEEEQVELLDDNADHLPEEVIDRRETARILEEAMSDLTKEQRTCILLHYEQGLKYREIARIQGVSEGTVKSRISYGLKNTEKKLRDMEKRGTKLYGVAPVPFFLYLLLGANSQTANAAQVSSGLWSKVAGQTVGQSAAKAGGTMAASGSWTGTAGNMAASGGGMSGNMAASGNWISTAGNMTTSGTGMAGNMAASGTGMAGNIVASGTGTAGNITASGTGMAGATAGSSSSMAAGLGGSAAVKAGATAAHMVSVKALIGTVIAATAVCAAVAGTSMIKLRNNDSKLKTAETQIEQLQKTVDDAEESSRQSDKDQQNTQDENETLQKDLEKLQKEYTELQKENKKLQEDNEDLEKDYKKLKKKYKKLQDQLENADGGTQDTGSDGSGADENDTSDYTDTSDNTGTSDRNSSSGQGSSGADDNSSSDSGDSNSLEMGDWDVE